MAICALVSFNIYILSCLHKVFVCNHSIDYIVCKKLPFILNHNVINMNNDSFNLLSSYNPSSKYLKSKKKYKSIFKNKCENILQS